MVAPGFQAWDLASPGIIEFDMLLNVHMQSIIMIIDMSVLICIFQFNEN